MNRLTLRRWVFSPVTSWQAGRLVRLTAVDHDTAWVGLRIAAHPDEVVWAAKRDAGR
ncbi:hypothetical protein [Streptomyces sp. Isolate_45]|uniref:hypothetical protein n=1 Tax=Streptomyces sp. Isolate_45 TaxID=2950111 RepID=UPI002482089D|nr:hypothetical protein [Streptomyces sp. Isolate_45]MDA5279937.1 hypothetical protein [Streptomyces sp. Isolate_45]